MNSISNSRVIQLDGLRFFAVTMVMVAHWLQWQWSNPVLAVIPFAHGVTLFFVLSGFLITRILLDTVEKVGAKATSKNAVLKWFYMRRVLRIFPIYYFLIFSLLLINYKNTREIFPWLLTYTSNIYQYLNNTFVGDFNHFWSLAVEEQFYLFWPLLLLGVRPNRRLGAIVVVISISILAKVFIYFFTDNWMAAAYSTISCMSVLGIGALLAYITRYMPSLVSSLAKPILLYVGVVVYVLLFALLHQQTWYKMVFDEVFFGIIAALIVLRASTNGFTLLAKQVLEHSHIVKAGQVSYGMYVYHLFMPPLFYYWAPKIGLSIANKYAWCLALYALTYFLSVMSWKWVEAPIQAKRDQLFPLETN